LPWLAPVKENAHVLDVNVDYVGRKWAEKICHDLVKRLVTNVNLDR